MGSDPGRPRASALQTTFSAVPAMPPPGEALECDGRALT
jgi:hypothetical protein